jgi:hypothetical protein
MTESTRSTKKSGSQRRRSKPAKNRSPRKAETVQKKPAGFPGKPFAISVDFESPN